MSLLRSFALVGSATLASRLTGFVRDILIAAVLGSGAVADAYLAAFLLPNLFRRVFSEGAFNAAMIPIYSRRQAEGGVEAATDFAETALAALAGLVLVLVLAAELAMPWLVGALAPGFAADPAKFADTVLFARIAFVSVGALILTAFLSSWLNVLSRFALAALAPLVLNLMLIPVLVVLLLLGWRGAQESGLVLVTTVLVAGIVQLAYVAFGLRRTGQRLLPLKPRLTPDVVRLFVLLLPALVLAGAGHVNMLIASQLASALPSAVAWLYYADRLFQLPLGFVASAIGVVLLPEVARAISRGETAAAGAGWRALEFGAMLVLPAAAALVILADPIVDVLYRRGAFTLADSRAVAAVLAALAHALPGFVLVKVLLPAFLARERFRMPLAAALAGMATNIAVGVAFRAEHGVVATAWGVTAAAWVNALVLALAIATASRAPLTGASIGRLLGILAAALVTGAATWAGRLWLIDPLGTEAGLADKGLALAVLCLAGVLVHGLALWAAGLGSPAELRAAVSRRDA